MKQKNTCNFEKKYIFNWSTNERENSQRSIIFGCKQRNVEWKNDEKVFLLFFSFLISNYQFEFIFRIYVLITPNDGQYK